MNKQYKIPLFRDYPKLEKQLPYVSLATLPTPVERLEEIGDQLGLKNLYIKRDDLSGAVYGGNKVRKLEFLLGNILRSNSKQVITLGFAGSNHALATAIYAQQLGLRSVSLLMPQVNAHYVRRNLLASQYYNAKLCHYRNITIMSLGIISQFIKGKIKDGVFPRFIPAGGSCPLGVIGYVNAAMELKDQIIAGKLPEPDLIYVPLGSMGTSAGLMLGIKAVGLKTRVIPIRVIEQKMASPKQMLRLISQTQSLLRELDPAFTCVRFSKDDLYIRNDCLGKGYAHFTEKAVIAADIIKRKTGIILNGTYSAKAFSAIFDDADRKILNGKTVLFWNTYNSRDLSKITAGIDYHNLPKEFHWYFEEDVQPLDKGKG
ncbi:MAG: pyridoxal-phosphate dependent enzyme [Candidatus Omnitrophica bacterium]|nr:pyridoxal-phosphate dependent enzyme [Candidatus Omnitrophota bacterium]